MAKSNIRKAALISHGDIAINRRARFDYEIIEEFEAGLVLYGSEVKSLRMGLGNIAEAYAGPRQGLLYLFNMRIGEYPAAPLKFQHEPNRLRPLLLKKKEMARLIGAVNRDRLTIIPLKLYFNARGLAKIKLGLGKGKKMLDKRETIKERDWQRRKSKVLAGGER